MRSPGARALPAADGGGRASPAWAETFFRAVAIFAGVSPLIAHTVESLGGDSSIEWHSFARGIALAYIASEVGLAIDARSPGSRRS